MKLNLARTKELVDTNISSIFTKQDVLNLLDNLDTGTDMDNITDLFEKIRNNFAHGLQCVKDNIVDKSDVTLELQGNEIYVDSIEVDIEVIESVLEEVLDDLETNLGDNNN